MKTLTHRKQTVILLAMVILALCATSCGESANESLVAVSGSGLVTAEPDMAQMNVALSHVAPTTKAAQEEVNRKVRQVLDILRSAGIADRDIRTASINFAPEYEWRNSNRVLLGQKATQSIVVTIYDIQQNSEKVPGILDRLAEVDKVEIRQLSFDIKDKSELFSRSRELAYQKALAKADEYAGLAGLRVDRALNISESGNAPVLLAQSRMMLNTAMDSAGGYAVESSTALPTGEIEITTEISVVFKLK